MGGIYYRETFLIILVIFLFSDIYVGGVKFCLQNYFFDYKLLKYNKLQCRHFLKFLSTKFNLII